MLFVVVTFVVVVSVVVVLVLVVLVDQTLYWTQDFSYVCPVLVRHAHGPQQSSFQKLGSRTYNYKDSNSHSTLCCTRDPYGDRLKSPGTWPLYGGAPLKLMGVNNSSSVLFWPVNCGVHWSCREGSSWEAR